MHDVRSRIQKARKTNVKSVGPSGYERRNRKVFKRCLKTASDDAEVMFSGSSFQRLAQATGNDRLPNVERRQNGAVKRLEEADLSYGHRVCIGDTRGRRPANDKKYVYSV